jgi:hypothetical protein
MKKVAPAWGFGSATRDQANKLFVSQEHTLIATGGMHSPGPAAYHLPASVGGKQPDGRKPDPPVYSFSAADRFLYGYGKPDQRPSPDTYEMPSSVGGKQPDGRRQDPPTWGFGTATRSHTKKVFVSHAHQKTDMYGLESPGPAGYVLPPSVGGKQPDGRKHDPPSWSFSSAARTPVEPGGHTPGPIYAIPAAVGPQPDGRLRNAPRYGLGASTREVRAKVFLGNDFQVGAAPNVPTPGPAGPYQQQVAMGKQVASKVHGRNATSPRMSFSRYSRWAHYEKELSSNTVPGPGAYG